MENRIDKRLRSLRASGKTALAPFVTVGYPDVDTSVSIARALLESGGDLLELGIPFSDPLADGPTVQKSSFHALRQGVNVRTGLDVAQRLRQDGVQAPLLLMGYLNPFLRFGLEKFARAASAAGVDGLIVPDLPDEEAGPLRSICDSQSLHLVPMLAPTSTERRIEQVCKGARGFIYCVSLTGVTGARTQLRTGVAELVSRIRRSTDLPLLVGFGVSRREHVENIGRFADGAVCASALLDAIDGLQGDLAVETARDFMTELSGSR